MVRRSKPPVLFPTCRSAWLVQAEPGPVTTIVLLVEKNGVVVVVSDFTTAPLLIVSRLPPVFRPTSSRLPMFHSVPAPVTRTSSLEFVGTVRIGGIQYPTEALRLVTNAPSAMVNRFNGLLL